MKKKLLLITGLLLIATTVFGQELGKWGRDALPDKFGDSTGPVVFKQIILGKGSNSTQSNAAQWILMGYIPSVNILSFGIKEIGALSFPLNMLLWQDEPITLSIKDSSGKIYSFDGIQDKDSRGGMMSIPIFPDNSLTALLRKSGTYKAVIEGKNWSCAFSFNGGMPE
jgi:hypothetical protein